jgi:hypothetical protein
MVSLYRWSDPELRSCAWWGRLPFPIDDIVPRRCPICGASAVPCFGAGGRLAPTWVYACEASYEPLDPARLRSWVPSAGCGLLSSAQVLGWVRELCERQAPLGPVAEALCEGPLVAPYRAAADLPVVVALPRWRKDEPPAVCPGCRAACSSGGRVEPGSGGRAEGSTVRQSLSRTADPYGVGFTCGARYGESPSRDVRQSLPRGGLDPAAGCPRPAVDHVLRVARAKGSPWIRAAAGRALVAYQRSVTVIQVFGAT